MLFASPKAKRRVLPPAIRLGGATPYAIGGVFLLLAAYVLYTATPYFDVSGG